MGLERFESEQGQDSLQPEILAVLEKHDIKLDPDRKDQHLLTSREVIDQLVAAADLTPADTVLEIGPGLGQITEALAEKAGQVHAIELDERFRPVLEGLQGKHDNLEVTFGSALEGEWPAANKVVANLPFSILEPLLERLIKEKRIESASLIVGDRYFQRCLAAPGRETRTSLITRAFFDVDLISKVDGDKFLPPNREGSMIMRLDRKDKKKADFGLRLLVTRMIRTPNESVISMMRDIIGERVSRRMDYRTIPSVRSLGIPDSTLRKSLRDLDNADIRALTRAVGSLKRKMRS